MGLDWGGGSGGGGGGAGGGGWQEQGQRAGRGKGRVGQWWVVGKFGVVGESGVCVINTTNVCLGTEIVRENLHLHLRPALSLRCSIEFGLHRSACFPFDVQR